MSFKYFHRKFRSGAPDMLNAAVIEREGAPLIRQAAELQSAKVTADRVGATPRQVYNWREGECQPQWPYLIMLAREYPELRAAVGRWLGFPEKEHPVAEAALDQIRRIVQQMPEEGDAG